MARRISKNESATFLVDRDTHPQTVAVLQTRADPIGVGIDLFDRAEGSGARLFGSVAELPRVVRFPDGDFEDLAREAHAAGAVVTAATDLLALTLIESPGEWERTLPSALHSASACLSVLAVPMPVSWRFVRGLKETCRVG